MNNKELAAIAGAGNKAGEDASRQGEMQDKQTTAAGEGQRETGQSWKQAVRTTWRRVKLVAR